MIVVCLAKIVDSLLGRFCNKVLRIRRIAAMDIAARVLSLGGVSAAT